MFKTITSTNPNLIKSNQLSKKIFFSGQIFMKLEEMFKTYKNISKHIYLSRLGVAYFADIKKFAIMLT